MTYLITKFTQAKTTYPNLEDIEKHHRLTWDDPSVYVQNACVTDPQMAPEGCSTVYALVPVSAHS